LAFLRPYAYSLFVVAQISKLKNASRINDKCLDMQKSAGKKKTAEEIAGMLQDLVSWCTYV
jgi:hypothetical protein